MTPPLTTYNAHRIFVRGIHALDIADPLASFDSSSSAEAALDHMRAGRLPAVGVRTGGYVTRIIERGALEEVRAAGSAFGSCAEHARPIEAGELLPESALLDDVVLTLERRPFLLVQLLGQPTGIIDRSDLEDPPVRMWLFGLLSLIEMTIVRRIEEWAGDEGDAAWRPLLSPSRLQKAEELQAERLRRGSETPLLHCLPFSDKGQIVARNRDLLDSFAFASRKRAEAVFKALERMRNNLAHMQPVVDGDWELIVLFAQGVEALLTRLEGASAKLQQG
jgi:hypothetical protein